MALFPRERTGEGPEVEVAICETMASFMLVEHANVAMFDPRWARDLPAEGAAESQAVSHQ
jgi:crotonobetainyl-CoA:carnitine CoA-transferase CaiB-like acyl-CoA transferase